MMLKKYIAEGVGTFALSFAVLVGLSVKAPSVAVPVIAGLTLALFVYIIGSISGCHINPSVTLGQLSLKKISPKHAGYYVIAQVLGAIAAMLLVRIMHVPTHALPKVLTLKVFIAETLGAFFFNFGIAAVVMGRVSEQMSGLVVGGSLLFGILVASLSGSAGILNPAVAISLGAYSVVYLLMPFVGAVLGVQAYKYLVDHK